jgi:2-succinyl-6-hydroxy-2,4-cyclohexadiene-1-carboxylate synthase
MPARQPLILLKETVAGGMDAPALVLLHGFLGTRKDWRPIVEELVPEYRCISVDLPGHGGSFVKDPARGFTFDAFCDVLNARLDELKVDQMALLGYSMGGRMALYYALRHPDRIRQLVLESASPGLKTLEERQRRRQSDIQLAAQLDRIAETEGDRLPRSFLLEWYAQPLFLTLKRHPETLERLLQRREQNQPVRLARSLRGLGTGMQPSLWERLPELAAPTLLIVGEEDRKFRQIAEQMQELSPRIALEVLGSCGHNVHLENLAGYTTVLKSFLATAGR